MIYPSNFEQKTGFDKVRLLVSDKCLSPLGKERVADRSFSTDFAFISNELDLVDEFVKIQQGETDFPANYFFDVRYSLKRIRPEGTWMDEKELFDLKRSITDHTRHYPLLPAGRRRGNQISGTDGLSR